MPRQMSFMLTTKQAYDKTKFVTRRLGWKFARVGDIIQQVEKGQGLKEGEHPIKIHLIELVEQRWEPLNLMVYDSVYGYEEVILEGFPDMTPDEFIAMFCEANKCYPNRLVNRLRFKYCE